MFIQIYSSGYRTICCRCGRSYCIASQWRRRSSDSIRQVGMWIHCWNSYCVRWERKVLWHRFGIDRVYYLWTTTLGSPSSENTCSSFFFCLFSLLLSVSFASFSSPPSFYPVYWVWQIEPLAWFLFGCFFFYALQTCIYIIPKINPVVIIKLQLNGQDSNWNHSYYTYYRCCIIWTIY